MVGTRRRSLVASLFAAVALVLGSVPPAHAEGAELDVVLVTQLTDWEVSFPQTYTYTGSGAGTDLQVWSFTETFRYDHGHAFGSFAMHSGADALSGSVRMTPTITPFLQLPLSGTWSYTVTEGQGSYAGCTGSGSSVREGFTTPLAPPIGVDVSAISFDLTCG